MNIKLFVLNLLPVGLDYIQFVFHLGGLANVNLKPTVAESHANSMNSMHAVPLSWEPIPVSGLASARVPRKTWIKSKG